MDCDNIACVIPLVISSGSQTVAVRYGKWGNGQKLCLRLIGKEVSDGKLQVSKIRPNVESWGL